MKKLPGKGCFLILKGMKKCPGSRKSLDSDGTKKAMVLSSGSQPVNKI
jgi:hypothetical protein